MGEKVASGGRWGLPKCMESLICAISTAKIRFTWVPIRWFLTIRKLKEKKTAPPSPILSSTASKKPKPKEWCWLTMAWRFTEAICRGFATRWCTISEILPFISSKSLFCGMYATKWLPTPSLSWWPTMRYICSRCVRTALWFHKIPFWILTKSKGAP